MYVGWGLVRSHFPLRPLFHLGGDFSSSLLTFLSSQVRSLAQSMVRPNGKAVLDCTTHNSSGFCLKGERRDGCGVGPRSVCHATSMGSCNQLCGPVSPPGVMIWLFIPYYRVLFLVVLSSWTQGGTWNLWALPRIIGLWWVMSLLRTSFSLLHSGTFYELQFTRSMFSSV